MAAPAAAAAPGVTFTPGSVTFASQAIGTTSPPQSVTITNSGDASLFIGGLSIGGADPLDFNQDGACAGVTLAAGTSCSVSVVFNPTASGTRTASFNVSDNAAGSPQSVPLTGNGSGTNPALAINDQFFTCSNGVCDIGAGHNVFVNNFFTTTFQATGGTSPYTWSGQPPSGLTLRPSGLLLGAPTSLGPHTFTVTVTDANGTTAAGTFMLTVNSSPAPTPPGCQTGGKVKEALSGASFNGQTPSGTALADETHFSGCGGFSTLSVSVRGVNLADGRQLWVTLDFNPVGVITLKSGSGTMPTYNMGDFGVSRDQIRIYGSLPDISPFQQILIGGSFR